jgi:hypothetical protein
MMLPGEKLLGSHLIPSRFVFGRLVSTLNEVALVLEAMPGATRDRIVGFESTRMDKMRIAVFV